MVINNLTPGTQWPVVISFKAAGIAMLFSGAIGVFFGFYPGPPRQPPRPDRGPALRIDRPGQRRRSGILPLHAGKICARPK